MPKHQMTVQINSLKKKIYDICGKALIAIAVDVHKLVKEGYESIVPIYDDKGNRLTEIPDNELAERVSNAVKLVIGDNNRSAMIYIDGEQENKEALRWYALGREPDNIRNPFLNAFYRLRNPNHVRAIWQSVDWED